MYSDPTAWQAIARVDRERKREQRRKQKPEEQPEHGDTWRDHVPRTGKSKAIHVNKANYFYYMMLRAINEQSEIQKR